MCFVLSQPLLILFELKIHSYFLYDNIFNFEVFHNSHFLAIFIHVLNVVPSYLKMFTLVYTFFYSFSLWKIYFGIQKSTFGEESVSISRMRLHQNKYRDNKVWLMSYRIYLNDINVDKRRWVSAIEVREVFIGRRKKVKKILKTIFSPLTHLKNWMSSLMSKLKK